MDIGDPLVSHLLFERILWRLPSPMVRILKPHQNILECVAARQLAPMIASADPATSQWETAASHMPHIVEEMHDYAVRLSAVRLDPAPLGSCSLCYGKEAAHAMPCCRATVHNACWVDWRLTNPVECACCGAVIHIPS